MKRPERVIRAFHEEDKRASRVSIPIQRDLDKSLHDAQKIARRLSRSIVTLKGHRAARDLCNVLRRLGAKECDG